MITDKRAIKVGCDETAELNATKRDKPRGKLTTHAHSNAVRFTMYKDFKDISK